MTVKIIKPAEDKFKIICKNCAVTLEYVRNDIITRHQKDYGGGSDEYHEIRCPACRYMNSVDEKPLVKNIWEGRIIDGRGYLPDELVERAILEIRD